MLIFTAISRGFSKFYKMFTELRNEPDFSCGECDQWRRCNLPPTEVCSYRARQIESGQWEVSRDRKRLKVMSQNMIAGFALDLF